MDERFEAPAVPGLARLPGDWLAPVPELQYLTLELPRLTALPVDFQTDTPFLHEVWEPGGVSCR